MTSRRLPHRFPLVLLCALFAAGHAAPAPAADRVTGKPFATRSEVYAPHAIAATSHPLAIACGA